MHQQSNPNISIGLCDRFGSSSAAATGRTSSLLLLCGLILALCSSSCGVTKFIPEGKYLNTDSEIILENEAIAADDPQMLQRLEEVLSPGSNKRFLGGHPGLYFYYKTQKDKPGFINRFLYKKIGEKPVYSSEVKTKEIQDLLLNRLDNRGYFYSRVTSQEQLKENKKESKVTYKIVLEKPYTLAKVRVESIPEPLRQAIMNVQDKTLMTPGLRFDLALIKLERDRIDTHLKAQGYYNFNPSFLIFEADTNQYAGRRFDLYLGLKKDVPLKALIPYQIEQVLVNPSVGESSDSTDSNIQVLDGIQFYGGGVFFRSDRLAPFITVKKGQLYNAKQSKTTARRLSTIGVYRFVNIQYEQLPLDSTRVIGGLNAVIELSPLNKRAVRAELQAVSKSNNFAGPALALTSVNRNLFKGGETLNISSNIGYEFQVGGANSAAYNFSIGLKGELIFPRLILPIQFNTNFFKYDIPKTKLSLSLDHSDRSGLYKLISASTAFGYDWNAARFVTHSISLISVNYTNLYQSSNAFDLLLEDNPFLKQSFEQQFIAGLNYSFTYNELLDSRIKNALFFNLVFETAGNSISLLARPGSSGELATFLGLQFAQFAKLDMDLRFHHRMRKDQTIATRLFGGYGIPYGNSEVMPFIKQFYSGGPYGLRAFGIRSIGPGSEVDSGANDSGLFEQTGNIKLEANLEYRFPLISYLKGAVFADVGNVWLSTPNPDFPNGTFGKKFINELGMGAGIGLRIDVQGFVLRFDFAAPFHDPSQTDTRSYKLRLGRTKFNFAIGYPF